MAAARARKRLARGRATLAVEGLKVPWAGARFQRDLTRLAALAAQAGLPPIEGRVITPSLEDVFIARLAELDPATPAGAAV